MSPEFALVPRFEKPRPLIVGVGYDVIPVIFHEHYLARPADYASYRRRFRQFAQSDLVLLVSELSVASA